MFVDLCLMYAYCRRKLERFRVVVSRRMAANGITRPGTLEFAKCVIVFTTHSVGSTAAFLRSYRMRWQIELVFKRLKSLAQLGHVPKHDDRSSRAWLYGKLLVTLLAHKLIRIGRDTSPSGYSLSARDTM